MNQKITALILFSCAALLLACNNEETFNPGDGDATDLVEEQTDGATEDAPADDLDVTGEECVSACGDSIVECGEQCDDGNTAGGDGCSSTCMIEPPPNCGDAVVDYLEGEQCDDGNTADGDGCSSACRIERPPSCGDGTLDIDSGEQCDDGNIAAGDGCGPSCRYETVGAACGNGTLEGLEVCDDDNLINGDHCNPTCSMTNTTTLLAGQPHTQGMVDGVGSTALLGGAGTITVDDSYIYLADGNNSAVRRVEIATAAVETIAGDGTPGHVDAPVGVNARFGWLEGPATDGQTLWVADGCRIRAVDLMPPFAVTTVVGSDIPGYLDGFAAAAQLEDGRGLTYYNGYVYFLDSVTATLRRFDPVTTEVVTLAGTAYTSGITDGPGNVALFMSPRYMTSDGSGMLYISDTQGNTIRSYNTFTTHVGTFAGNGTSGYIDAIGTAARVHRPRGMTSDGTSIYWVEVEQNTIRQAVLSTASITTMLGTHCGGATPCPSGYNEGFGTGALFDQPFSIAFHFPTNSFFIVDGGNAVIRRVQ